jgi:hypothetical protein
MLVFNTGVTESHSGIHGENTKDPSGDQNLNSPKMTIQNTENTPVEISVVLRALRVSNESLTPIPESFMKIRTYVDERKTQGVL